MEEIAAAAAGIDQAVAGPSERRKQLGGLRGASHLLDLVARAPGIKLAQRRAVLPDAMARPTIFAQVGHHARLPARMKAEAMKWPRQSVGSASMARLVWRKS